MNKVASELGKIAALVSAAEDVVLKDWTSENKTFARELVVFDKNLDRYRSYLEKVKRSAMTAVARSNSGDIKAAYENLMRRVKEMPRYVDELGMLVEETREIDV